jgi:hypothetical protein
VNEQEQENFEAELRRARAARPPEHFMARLKAAKPDTEPALRTPLQAESARPGWLDVLRWLAPAMAVVVLGLLVWRVNFYSGGGVAKKPLSASNGLIADDVQVDQELVSSFDVVAKLPSGEPVRFRCQKWNDQLVVTDKNRGVEIAQNNPRVEVVPLRFETY